jgi:uncharacterized protein (DUF433 family)
MEIEFWKPVKDYEGLYEISSLGRCYSARTNKILSPSKKATYDQYLLSNGKQKQCSAHVLVLQAFIGDRPDGLVINHIDGNQKNNCISNLEYCTQSENVKHAYRIGLRSQKGEENNHSKLTEIEVVAILDSVKAGNLKHNEIAKKYNIAISTLSAVIHGKVWPQFDRTGIKCNYSKSLTADDVQEIRIALKKGTKQSELAAKYNVARSSISGILNKRSWTALPEPVYD